MSFMAVAYVPAYLEDHATFTKDRLNGLYTALPFLLSNILIGIPFLFLIALLFSLVAYFLTNFSTTAAQFFMFVMWLFLDLLAAESLVVLVTSLFPNFVLSLAIVAFANGLFMSVGGFLIPLTRINAFWHYAVSYLDYQRWVFQGMMVNELGGTRTYSCGPACKCMYPSLNPGSCSIGGQAVLDLYGYDARPSGTTAKWVGIMLGIIVGYRILGWLALTFKK